jgi:aminobenzoyl-glutamate utilization protein B
MLLLGCGDHVLADAGKATAMGWVDAHRDEVTRMSRRLWDLAEVAFQEHASTKLLADWLAEGGFAVQRGVADMPTAWVATYGRGKPVITLLAEYDALPGLSQQARPEPVPRVEGAPGHGCGHNLLGTASAAAGLALAAAIDGKKLPGTIKVYGTPAEEGGAGKVYMVRAGLFDDVDAVLTWHPSTANHASANSNLAVKRARFQFRGLSAHAAGAPHQGHSALDAVELMNIGVNFMREHVVSDARIHYVITDGGRRPNVVPDFAEVWYYARAPKMAVAQQIFERLQEIAGAAALMTRTKMKMVDETGTYEILPNRPLAELFDANLRAIGAPPFDAADQAFAAAIGTKLVADGVLESLPTPALRMAVDPIRTQRSMGSTDVGDVSWIVPTGELRIAANANAAPGHSWCFVATAGSAIGDKATITAAKVLAATAVDLMTQPDRLAEARNAFENATASFTYKCGIPADAEPPKKLD